MPKQIELKAVVTSQAFPDLTPAQLAEAVMSALEAAGFSVRELSAKVKI